MSCDVHPLLALNNVRLYGDFLSSGSPPAVSISKVEVTCKRDERHVTKSRYPDVLFIRALVVFDSL